MKKPVDPVQPVHFRSASPKRSSTLHIALTLIAAPAVAILTLATTLNPLVCALAFFATLFLGLCSWLIGTRALLAGILLFLIPPGVLGEASYTNAAVSLTTLLIIAFTYRPTHSLLTPAGAFILVSGIALPGIGMLLNAAPLVAVVFGVSAVIVSLSIRRPEFILDCMKGIFLVLSVLCLSYFITLTLHGFSQGAVPLRIGLRSLEFYLPGTVATSGPPFIEGSRRFAPLVGEPGLAVFLVLPFVAAAFSSSIPRRWRFASAALAGSVIVASQSFAGIVAVALGAAIGIVCTLARRRHYASVVAVSLVVGAIAPTVIYSSLEEKSRVAASSVTDRSIADAGGASTASLGNINLLVASSNAPFLALCLALGLVMIALIAFRALPGAIAWMIFSFNAVFAQPTQWHIGAWMLLCFTVIFTFAERTRTRPAEYIMMKDATHV